MKFNFREFHRIGALLIWGTMSFIIINLVDDQFGKIITLIGVIYVGHHIQERKEVQGE